MFFGPSSHDENRAAHGNICVIEECECGAERRTNVNQCHIEEGEWSGGDVAAAERRRNRKLMEDWAAYHA